MTSAASDCLQELLLGPTKDHILLTTEREDACCIDNKAALAHCVDSLHLCWFPGTQQREESDHDSWGDPPASPEDRGGT